MERWLVALFVSLAVVVGVLGQGWASWLEHRRRVRTLDLIRMELDAGREPASELYDQVGGKREAGAQAPLTEVVIFTALSVGFWIGYFNTEGEGRVAFLSVAAAMTLTALGCLVLVLLRLFGPGDGKR